MATTFGLLQVIFITVLGWQPPPAKAEDVPNRNKPTPGKPLKIFTQTGLGGHELETNNIGPLSAPSPYNLVVRSAEELAANSGPGNAKDPIYQKQVQGKIEKLLKVESIDWNKQMVVAIWGSASRGNHTEVIFSSFQIQGKELLAEWSEQGSWKECYVTSRGIALVERFDGPVVFRFQSGLRFRNGP